jgi:hypothetical protein
MKGNNNMKSIEQIKKELQRKEIEAIMKKAGYCEGVESIPAKKEYTLGEGICNILAFYGVCYAISYILHAIS